MPRTFVIVNPAAGRGRGARLLRPATDAFERHGGAQLRVTERTGDEARLTQDALASGAQAIVIIGGDGTWNRCAAAVLDAKAGTQVRLAFVAGGTGNDFAKNIGAPARDLGALAALVADSSAERLVDAGAVESAGRTHWFLNVAGFGFDALVLEDLAGRGGSGGVAAYVGAALRRLLTYPGFAFTQHGPNGGSHSAMMHTCSNGHTFGGTFRIAPDARVDDGLIDHVTIGDVHGLARLRLFVRALRGGHVAHPKVRVQQRARVELTFPAPPTCDLDGELVRLGSKDVVVRAVPRALRVVARPA
jgi:diacylglycerol kinase (ATP)